MKIRTVLDGNAFYDIDEECLLNKKVQQSSQIHEVNEYKREKRDMRNIQKDREMEKHQMK